jgi:NADH-quinone oxidoreductase subunit N
VTFEAPHIEYSLVLPILIVLGAAVVGVLVEAAVPRARRFWIQVGIAAVGMVAGIVAAVNVLLKLDPRADKPKAGFLAIEDALAVDGPAVYCWLLILLLGLLGVLLFAERQLEGGVTALSGQAAALPGTDGEREASARGLEHTEVFPLLLFTVGGMLIFPAANDLLTLFVALEVLSLPLYLLCGLARRRRLLSQEAALKYFMLGAFSSAFFVYGIALTYGFAGSMHYAQIANAVSSGAGNHALLLGGMGLLAVGMLFKTSAVPFHAWTPDVYQGAPTSVTAFMAAATKVAAFGAMLRLFYVAFGAARWDWMPMFWVIAILTMFVGSVVALVQTDVKRLLAYSSIAHAGFILVGFLGARSLSSIGSGSITPVQAVLFYVTTYGLMTMAAFAIVTVVRDSGGEATHLSRWSGLGKESPLVAGLFAFLLLGMAGIPLTSGFTGKWAVFAAALANGAWPLVVIAVLMSAVAAYFYLRIIVVMYFAEPVGEGPTVTMPSVLSGAVIAVGVAATLALGVVPGPLLDALGRVAQLIR